MNEFQAAMGLANLVHMPEILAERKSLVKLYREQLQQFPGIQYFIPEEIFDNYEYNYSYFPILVHQEYSKTRDELYNYLLKKGIYSRKYFYPIITELGCYRKQFKDMHLPIAQKISKQVLCLPLYNGLSPNTVTEICSLIKKFPKVGHHAKS